MAEAILDLGWENRLRADRARAALNQQRSLQVLTDELLSRATRAGSLAVALTGSTARGQRTAISDLDYHVVGQRPDLEGLPGEVDVVADSLERFQARLADGDDFVQWTLRHGCVLHDPQGVMRAAHERIKSENLWPDAQRKFDRADALADIAERVLTIEDRDAGQEQVRAALTSLARGLLLADRIFPLARAELSDQLHAIGYDELAEWLQRSIHDVLALGELAEALAAVRAVDQLQALRT